jgi:hypothetical protein
LGTFGRVGVTGINFGGVRAGRLAACFARASRTISFVTAGGWAVVASCLNGIARIAFVSDIDRPRRRSVRGPTPSGGAEV